MQIDKDVQARIGLLAASAGRRAAARAYLQGVEGDELLALEQAERERIEKYLTQRFADTGQLPPLLVSDLADHAPRARYDSEGRLAPPVIHVTNAGPVLGDR